MPHLDIRRISTSPWSDRQQHTTSELQRPYLKGRDVYDLVWFLSDPDWPEPNLVMLNNALQQTGRNWREAVRDRFQNAPWERVVDDVRPFLEPRADLTLLSYENVMQVLGR